MRIFLNCKEAASEIKREVTEMGKEVRLRTYQDKNIEGDPNFFTRELIAYSYMIHEPKDKEELLKSFGKDSVSEIAWCQTEFEERISGKNLNPGTAMKLRNKVWTEFLDEKGKFSYTYSERIGEQLDKIVEMLKTNPNSRNAIVSIWDRQIDQDRIGGKMRVPCSMYYQFLIRDNKLHLIYNIRSNDVFTHWCFDVWMSISMMEYVAEKLELGLGDFYQQIGSLHAYSKDIQDVF